MKKILVIAGPTAVGKTEYAIEAAKAFQGEIVSCDSMQLYKYMDIGSAKPTAYEQKMAKHHLIDAVDPREEFSVAMYQKMAKKAIEDIFNKNKLPVIAGGTGLYLNSLLYDMDFGGAKADIKLREKYENIAKEQGNHALFEILKKKDPKAAERLHENNVKRIVRALENLDAGNKGIEDFKKIEKKTNDYDVILIGLTRNRQELYDRINKRVDIMMDAGLLYEVKSLMDMGLTAEHTSMKGIGYKELIGAINGEYDFERAVELIKRNSRRYAKRQLTWFRRYKDMKWFDLSFENTEDMLLWIEKEL